MEDFWPLDSITETSLIGPPCGPTLSGPINEVAPLLKTSLMQPLKVVALLTRFSKSQQLEMYTVKKAENRTPSTALILIELA